MDKDEALRRKRTYDNYQAAMASEFGDRLRLELERIEAAAVAESMKPNYDQESHMKQVEARGKYQVVQKVRAIFRDIENEYEEAAPILTEEVVESQPVDTSA